MQLSFALARARVQQDKANRWLREVAIDLFADPAMRTPKAKPAQKSA